MEPTVVTVHPDTDKPTKAWSKIKIHQKKEKLRPLDPRTPITDDKIRFLCLSDTHSVLEKTEGFELPPADILLHAGDFSNIGRIPEIQGFNAYLGKLPYKVKIVIAGNHDMTFDDDMIKNKRDRLHHSFRITPDILERKLEELKINSVKELLTNCTYLEDKEIKICGIKLYGTPWQPEFCDWGFNLRRGQECLDKWNLIPSDTDILISHGPAIGYGDECHDGYRAGCVELLSTIQQRVHPKYHIFGHIHEAHGVTTDGHTVFINASTCNLRYKAANSPIVFDYPIPAGHSKAELCDKLVL